MSLTSMYALKLAGLLVSMAATAYILMVGFLALKTLQSSSMPLEPRGERLMVVVAHPDDEVIVAGGYCYENLRRGGEVMVVFTTTGSPIPDPQRELVRLGEAKAAWELAGVPAKNIISLGYLDLYGLQANGEIGEATTRLRDLIVSFRPEIIVTSLFENGHYQHDVTNMIVAHARELAGAWAPILEAPEYNFYYSFQRTPEKLLEAALRLLPRIDLFAHSPEFIDDRPILEFRLSKEQREIKCRMLSCYSSQAVDWMLRHFTRRERFQIYRGYDYGRPPFEYDGSFAQAVNSVSHLPIVSHYVRKLFSELRAEHPDPEKRYATFGIPDTGSGHVPKRPQLQQGLTTESAR